jgi:hypothetical protein
VAQGQKAGCLRPSILLRVTFAQSIDCFKRRGNKPASRRNWYFIVPAMTTALESSCGTGNLAAVINLYCPHSFVGELHEGPYVSKLNVYADDIESESIGMEYWAYCDSDY